MKRYRVVQFDFDTRVLFLTMKIPNERAENVKKIHQNNKEQTIEDLIVEYWKKQNELKIQNFIDLGSKNSSILAFHNKFLDQIRNAFVIGSYYPALTWACALGERILNHLIITLRDFYKSKEEYKKIYRKESFDDWKVAIDTLESWDILLPTVVSKYRDLQKMRRNAIHFQPEVDTNDRELALKAIHCLQDIIKEQFSGFWTQPWFITSIPGERYIKKEWEDVPFIKTIYLPNCTLVGPKHIVEKGIMPFKINDNFEYKELEVSNEDFAKLRKQKNNK